MSGHPDLFGSDMKPSVASLQASVMSVSAAAAAYQSQLRSAAAAAAASGLAPPPGPPSLAALDHPQAVQSIGPPQHQHHHHQHHPDTALLHDYHSLWQWATGYGYGQSQ